jgi:prepilin-type processing-associated H-X9-DG protein
MEGFKQSKPMRREAAFTAKELVVVVAVMSLVVCVQISALTGGSVAAKIAQCAVNLKEHAAILQAYGNDHNSALPNSSFGGNWPWDLPFSEISILTKNYGLTRSEMYCPGFPQQNIDIFWSGAPFGPYATTGYAEMLPGTPAVPADDLDIALTTQRYTLNGSDPSVGAAGATVYIPPAKRVVLADATISLPGQTNAAQASNYKWTLNPYSGVIGNPAWNVTPYGPFLGTSTPHMGAVVPLGGNVALLDGHVQWRPFTNMLVRDNTGVSIPFWW